MAQRDPPCRCPHQPRHGHAEGGRPASVRCSDIGADTLGGSEELLLPRPDRNVVGPSVSQVTHLERNQRERGGWVSHTARWDCSTSAPRGWIERCRAGTGGCACRPRRGPRRKPAAREHPSGASAARPTHRPPGGFFRRFGARFARLAGFGAGADGRRVPAARPPHGSRRPRTAHGSPSVRDSRPVPLRFEQPVVRSGHLDDADGVESGLSPVGHPELEHGTVSHTAR